VAIIAVTASAFDDMCESIFAAGADGWLRKPCREALLLHEVARLIGVQYRHVAPHAGSSSLAKPLRTARPGSEKGLPPALAEALCQAARVADYDRLGELIAMIPLDDACLAEDLRQLADRYAYDEIERRVECETGTRADANGDSPPRSSPAPTEDSARNADGSEPERLRGRCWCDPKELPERYSP
jgi:hypothetical protein